MDSSLASSPTGNATPPIAFVVAVWLGMSHDDILAGLAAGTIVPPPGQPAGWTPPGWTPGDSGMKAGSTGTSSGGSVSQGGGGEGGGPEGGGSEGGLPSEMPMRTTVDGWLRAIDPSVDAARLDALWNSSGSDDAARGAFWRGYLQRVLGVPADKSTAPGATLDTAITAAAADPAHRATIVPLGGLSGADIATLAKTDAGVRYAIERMDPVAVTGNRAMSAALDPTGELDRYDPNSGEQMLTDAYIADRSKLTAWKLRSDAGGDLAIGDSERWTFVDRAHAGADGKPFTLTLEGEEASAATVAHQVVFGTSGADAIGGGEADDRLYGGSGDDFIRGGAGNDRVEGGRGDDTLVGGRGNDALVGNSGNDDVDGGAGNDALDGGSGDDTLAGGRGDDTLDGGAGNDTYTFDSGDGRDVIVDADGRGRVLLDDIALSGSGMTRGADGVWRSADGTLEMRFSGTADEPGVLSIRPTATGSANGGGDEIRIRGFHNGDLGIALGDGSTRALVASSDTAATDGHGTDNEPPPIDLPDTTGVTQSTDSSGDGTSASTMPDTTDGTTAPSDASATVVTDGPPDITEAIHPLDSLWAMHDRTLDSLPGSLVDHAAIASAASAFGDAPPDVSLVATPSHAATDALGASEIASAASFSGDDAPSALALESAAATRGNVLVPHEASLAALSAPVDGRQRSRAA